MDKKIHKTMNQSIIIKDNQYTINIMKNIKSKCSTCFIAILTSLISLTSATVYATDWAILDGDGKTSNLLELDMDSIQQFGPIAKSWVRVSYPKPIRILEGSKDTYSSVIYRMIIDCKNARYVFSSSVLYSQVRARGEVLGSTKLNEKQAIYEMRDIAPDTSASAVLNYSCNQLSANQKPGF
jgi:hypothetical protein